MMGLYTKYVLPRLLNRNMGSMMFDGIRAQIVQPAHGIVLEIGFGSGYNLPFYKNVDKLYALDPSSKLYQYAQDRIQSVSFPVQHLLCSAEKIPLENESVDTVISTWTLCSIPNPQVALNGVKRVLKPHGKFIFIEHGQSPKRLSLLMQNILTPFTRHLTGNCHLNRKMDDLIHAAGFTVESLETYPEKGRPLMFSYRGTTTK